MSPKVSIIIPAYNVEKYINKMLKSVQNQTMKDFEAIIVNDGSTDNTQKLIDKYCQNDDRFKNYIKENGGVSSARNLGLDKATGEYIVFWDPDDYIPSKSLEMLCMSIEMKHADMAIGKIGIKYLSEKNYPKSIVSLTKRPYIDKMNGELVWVFSASNKIYKRDIIEANNIRFLKTDLGEDSIFWFQYIKYCDLIASCNEEVYEYRKRFFLDNSPSLTQKSNRYDENYFCNYISNIEVAIEEIFDKYLPLNEEEQFYKNKFMQELYKRFMKNNVVGDIYRNIWLFDNNELIIMYNAFNSLKEKLYKLEYEKVQRSENDLLLEDRLLLPDEILDIVQISFVVTREIEVNEINNVVKSFYMQKFPLFEVLIDESIVDKVDVEWLSKKNCRVIKGKTLAEIKNEALNCSKAKYIMFYDSPIICGENTIKAVINKVKANENIISLYYKFLNNSALKEIDILDKAFTLKDKSLLCEVDNKLSNKIFKVDYLKQKFEFTNDSKLDIENVIMNHKIAYKKGIKMIALKEEAFSLKLKNKLKIKILELFIRQ